MIHLIAQHLNKREVEEIEKGKKRCRYLAVISHPFLIAFFDLLFTSE